MQGLKSLKNISERDRKMIADAENMLGPEPGELGFAKNLFWGRFRDDLIFPYPEEPAEEKAKCDALLAKLEPYMRDEHPSILIDQEEYIPDWALQKLFDFGVMGLTVPEQYGGLGLGVTSYNRVLECIGAYCGSTAVVVSAHQSIGCKAIMLFGNEEQKQRFLPKVANEYLSGFCLSEPMVGSDAAGQRTRCELSEDGTHYILNGEKKWTTSGALSGLFTVTAKQKLINPKTGKEKDAVTALICTPDMEGVEIFEKNRSKAGIRGTWQARVRFTDVKVPVANRLHKEGKGLNVALTCLNYGRCTLSAGIMGAAERAKNQAIKWVQTRYQFDRPLAEFELVQQHIARMSALTYGMRSVLYMMTGMLDRGDTDIMVETAMTKFWSSDAGWQVIDDAMQIMGGEGYMTEVELERIWRDHRIHRIVEGSNEVMQSFIFAYGGKQLAEQMLTIQAALGYDPDASLVDNAKRLLPQALNLALIQRAIPLGLQLFLGVKPAAPTIYTALPALQEYGDRLAKLVQRHSHYFKMVSKWEREAIVSRQVQQARIADNAVYMFVLACSLSRLEWQMRKGEAGAAFEADRSALAHLFDMLELRFYANVRELRDNADDTMAWAADAARRHNDTLPTERFYLPEVTPVNAEGRLRPTEHIQQFPGNLPHIAGDGATTEPPVAAEG
ncbi:MAG: acyl-CoA dehydrogenase family protein [Bacteroidota bacterium]